MPSLLQILNSPNTQVASSNLGNQIEPLGGPVSIESLMDRFPEEVYQRGRDTHLYRFISALCGDAGAAMCKKGSFALRLRNEAELIQFADLDAFYTSMFNFVRLADEVYSNDANPNTDALTTDQWNDVLIKDQSYRARALDMMTSTRLGNTPLAMTYAAEAATGVEADVVEQYQYIFDQWSDDPLGVVPYGLTTSVFEYVVLPRVIGTNGIGGGQTYLGLHDVQATFTPPTLTTTSKPISFPTGGNAFSVAYSHVTGSFYELLPSYEHNLINIMDRLGPVGALATISEQQSRWLNVPIAVIDASSERLQMVRYVTGSSQVNWPAVDQTGNYFIEAGVENPTGLQYGNMNEQPVVYLTLQSANAYTNYALDDPNYNTNNFFGQSGQLATFYQYQSESVGSFSTFLTQIFPFLAAAPTTGVFDASQAIAIHNTPLSLTASASPDQGLLVNSLYPLDYFTLNGVDDILYPDQYWWASKSRYACEDPTNSANYLAAEFGGIPSSEYLEIDLGTIREVNYISADILSLPLNITIAYDVISGIDGVHSWVEVQQLDTMDFDNQLIYNANNRNAWQSADYYFTDSDGSMVNTRYIRIEFDRRDEAWPIPGITPFQWPVLVANLRCARYIASELDTIGFLVGYQDYSGGPVSTETTYTIPSGFEVRQQFRMPVGTTRGDIQPEILGLGVLIETNQVAVDSITDLNPHLWQWSLYEVRDFDNPIQGNVLLQAGTTSNVVSEGKTWMDFYFPPGITVQTDYDTVYELRVSSLNPIRSNTVWLKQENLSFGILPGNVTFTNGSLTLATTQNLTSVLFEQDLIQNQAIPNQTYTVYSVTSTTITLTTPYLGATQTGTAIVVDPLKIAAQ